MSKEEIKKAIENIKSDISEEYDWNDIIQIMDIINKYLIIK